MFLIRHCERFWSNRCCALVDRRQCINGDQIMFRHKIIYDVTPFALLLPLNYFLSVVRKIRPEAYKFSRKQLSIGCFSWTHAKKYGCDYSAHSDRSSPGFLFVFFCSTLCTMASNDSENQLNTSSRTKLKGNVTTLDWNLRWPDSEITSCDMISKHYVKHVYPRWALSPAMAQHNGKLDDLVPFLQCALSLQLGLGCFIGLSNWWWNFKCQQPL